MVRRIFLDMRFPPVALVMTLVAYMSARAEAPLFLVDSPFDAPQLTTIYEIDPATGVLTVRADLGSAYTPILGMAAEDGRTLYVAGSDTTGLVCTGLSETCLLLRVVLDPASTTPVAIEVVGAMHTGGNPVSGIVGMTFRSDGVLFGESQDDNGLYTIDPVTAEATLVATSDVELHGGDVTFDADDHLLVWTNSGGVNTTGLYELNPATAAGAPIEYWPGSNCAGLTALGHGSVLYAANVFTDRLYLADPASGFTGESVPMLLDGVRFDHKRGDLDSPRCVDDAACDDADPCTRDRCTAGGCRHLHEDTTCDGVDDDCDGMADEDYAGHATACGIGPCASTGATTCVDGSVQDGCLPLPGAFDDTVCNGIDDDCDGAIDEDGDPDGDAVGACFDNCPAAANPAQADADSDGRGDDCDCAPADPLDQPPAEVGSSLRLDRAPLHATLEWSETEGPFRAYRGYKRSGAAWAYNQYCVGATVNASSVDDALIPPPGTLFYYLISREGCTESVLGRDGTGTAIPNVDPCPSTGQDPDGDGTEEAIDNCPGVFNPAQDDADGDGRGDACE